MKVDLTTTKVVLALKQHVFWEKNIGRPNTRTFYWETCYLVYHLDYIGWLSLLYDLGGKLIRLDCWQTEEYLFLILMQFTATD